jgi:hypothetical protein
MEKATFSRLHFKRRFPMKRFVVLVLMGALSVAGETSLAFGQNVHPQPGSNPQAKKAQPSSAHAKRPPSKSPTQVKKSAPQAQRPVAQAGKSPSHRGLKVDVPKGGPQPPAKKSPAKPGSGSYSWDDYTRDFGKASQELQDGENEDLAAELQVAGGALAGATGGPPGVLLGAGGEALANLPQLIQGKAKELKGAWDGVSATGKFIGAEIDNMSKSNPRPTKPGVRKGK